MDRETLKNYRDLLTEIKRLNYRIEKLKRETVEIDSVRGSNPNFPYQEVMFNIEGIVDNSVSVRRLQARLKKRQDLCLEEREKIEDFINHLPSSRLRLIFDLRYIEGKSWLSISKALGAYEESYSRKIHDRYFDSLEEFEGERE